MPFPERVQGAAGIRPSGTARAREPERERLRPRAGDCLFWELRVTVGRCATVSVAAFPAVSRRYRFDIGQSTRSRRGAPLRRPKRHLSTRRYGRIHCVGRQQEGSHAHGAGGRRQRRWSGTMGWHACRGISETESVALVPQLRKRHARGPIAIENVVTTGEGAAPQLAVAADAAQRMSLASTRSLRRAAEPGRSAACENSKEL